MPLYLFHREDCFYLVEETSDEKVLSHVPLNPGTLKIVRMPDEQVIYEAAGH